YSSQRSASISYTVLHSTCMYTLSLHDALPILVLLMKWVRHVNTQHLLLVLTWCSTAPSLIKPFWQHSHTVFKKTENEKTRKTNPRAPGKTSKQKKREETQGFRKDKSQTPSAL